MADKKLNTIQLYFKLRGTAETAAQRWHRACNNYSRRAKAFLKRYDSSSALIEDGVMTGVQWPAEFDPPSGWKRHQFSNRYIRPDLHTEDGRQDAEAMSKLIEPSKQEIDTLVLGEVSKALVGNGTTTVQVRHADGCYYASVRISGNAKWRSTAASPMIKEISAQEYNTIMEFGGKSPRKKSG